MERKSQKQTGKTPSKKRKAKIHIRDRRPTRDQLTVEHRRLKPTLQRIRDAAIAAGQGDPAKTKAAVWRLLPNSEVALESLANAAARYGVSLVRGTALQKLACHLTAPNRRKWSWDAWEYSQALQQLFPVWQAGLLREFRFSFHESLSPPEISSKMSSIRDNIFEDFGFRTTYVLSKHKKETKKGETMKYTAWHVHGFLWPLAGPEENRRKFARQFSEIIKAVKKNKWIAGDPYWRTPSDLPRAAAYLAFNYYRGTCYRRMLGEKYKPVHEQLPPDASEGVRLFSVPEQLWLRPGEERPQSEKNKKCDRPSRARKEDSRYVPWRTLRDTGRVTPFGSAYRAAAGEMATNYGMQETRQEDKFDTTSRREIFRRACQDTRDTPSVPTVMGYDGFVYHVIVGNAQWFETPFYLLWREEVPEDYTLLGKPVPEKMEEIAFPISLFALHKLAQAELSVHTPRANFRPVCPVTGKNPKPICLTINLPGQVGRAAEIDGALEAQWLRRAKKTNLRGSVPRF